MAKRGNEVADRGGLLGGRPPAPNCKSWFKISMRCEDSVQKSKACQSTTARLGIRVKGLRVEGLGYYMPTERSCSRVQRGC